MRTFRLVSRGTKTLDVQLEGDKSFRIQVKGERLNVPENATCSVEHERLVLRVKGSESYALQHQ